MVHVYKGLECVEAGRVSHSDYVYLKAIAKGNTLMKFNRNVVCKTELQIIACVVCKRDL